MKWSERAGTRAAHKLPNDWEDQCRRAFLRIAYTIKEHDIPPSLFVNTDQTQLVYAPGTKLTWAETGAKQVSVVGLDEKRAVTLVVSVANNGDLLPFQVVYKGHSSRSLPQESAKHYKNCIDAGMKFESSKTNTYWSTEETMKRLVNDIISPYFARQREKLNLPPKQKAIWFIDCWSVHRSKTFRAWMRRKHSNIIMIYVPGGCTGICQPCDVGIQRLLKHVLKWAYHRDVVDEISAQLDAEEKTIEVNRDLKHVRDASVSWVWEAYEYLNKAEIVKKVKRTLCFIRLYRSRRSHAGI